MSKKSFKTLLSIEVGVFVLVTGLSLANVAGAVVEQIDPDPRISSLSATPASTTPGATTAYTFSFTLSEAMPQGGSVTINFQSNGNCEGDWQLCQVSFANVGEENVSGINGLQNFSSWDQGFDLRKNSWATGTYTVTLNGVRNPSQIGGHYRAYAETMAQDEEPEPCEPGEQCPQGPRTISAPVFFGAVGIKGTVSLPNDDPASNVSVDIRSEDFSVNEHANTDDLGFYAIMANRLTVGTNYSLEVWTSGNQDLSDYVSPTPIAFTYGGSTLTKNAKLRNATKTVTGIVKYNDGTVVKTGYEVWSNAMGGGGGKNAEGSLIDGQYSITLAGGSYDLGLNAGWVCDQAGCHERSVDWTYNQPPMTISFANDSTIENKTVNFVVQKTNAKVKGKVVDPNGKAIGGHLEFGTGEGPGMGGHVDQNNEGKFNINVMAGTYKMRFWPDTWQNPDNSRYYLPERTVTVKADQTLDLGTITLSKKTSKITGQVLTEDSDPVGNVRVNCWMREGSGWGDATTNNLGVYSVWLSPGTYECDIDRGPDSNYIPVSQDKVSAYLIKANQSVTAKNITVQEVDGRIVVKLVDKNGEPITNFYGGTYARLKTSGKGPNNEFNSYVDRGTSTIPLLGGSTYIVGVHTPPDQSSLLAEAEKEVYVPEGGEKEVKITMVAPDGKIKGFLKDQNGKLITNVDAEIFSGTDEGGMWMNTRLNPDGSFELNVKGGKKYFVGYWLRNNPEFVQTHPEEVPFLVPKNGMVTKVLTAQRANAYAEITLLDPEGNPVEFGFAWCSNHRYMEDKIQSDVKGQGIIDAGGEIIGGTGRIPLIAGKYECGAGSGPEMSESGWMPPDIVEIEVTPNDPAKISLEFTKADSIINGQANLIDGESVGWGWCHGFSENGQHTGGEVFNGVFSIPVNSGTVWFIGCDTDMEDGFYRSEEIMISVPKTGTYNQDIILDKKSWNLPKGETFRFDPSTQQSLNLPDGTTLTIPAGAIATGNDTVTVMASPNINLFVTADTKPVNFAWNFEALDSNNQLVESFNSNVNICIPYNENVLSEEGVNEDTIVSKYYDETSGTWQMPTGVSQDKESNIICFSVDHFTNFALTSGTADIRSAGTTGNYDVIAAPLSGGGPQVILADENGNILSNFFAYSSSLRIGLQVVTADINGDGEYEIITAPGTGAGPQIRVFNHQGQLITQFFAYDSGLRTGINVTAADINGDGAAEIITSTMAGAGPQIRVFNDQGNIIYQFFAYAESFRGGLTVTAGDVDGDGVNELITAPCNDAGPQIGVFNADGSVVARFFAYAETIRGGYNINVGDVDGDGTADIVVSPKAGNGPQVAVFNGSGDLMARFFAYAESFRGGVNASIGDVDGDGDNDIVVSPESDAGPQIRVFDGDGNILSQFWAYSSHLRGNFTSFVADLNGDGTTEIVTAPGAGMGPQVRTFNHDGTALSQYFTHHAGFRGGIYINKAL